MWTEVSRSDAIQMISHHFITIALLVASYLTNFVRLGSIILLIHDLSDVPLEFAKCLNYTAKARGGGNLWMQPYVDIIFGIFMVTFFVTRLVIYPRQVLMSLFIEGIDYFGCNFLGCYVFLGLLVALQCLHIFWFYLIARMAYGLLVVGKVEKDVRSDDEGEDVVEADGPPKWDEIDAAAAAGKGALCGGCVVAIWSIWWLCDSCLLCGYTVCGVDVHD
jgi:ceramide synthetase